MTSWWDTNGAASLITGVIALLSLAAGLFFRPLIERRLRREQHQEETIQDAKQFVMDLQPLLMRGFNERSTREDRADALEAWRQSLGSEAIALATFAPSDQMRSTAKKLWLEVDRLSRYVERIERTGVVPEFDTEKGLYFDETVGEAAFALEQFIEAIGGPKAPTRDQFSMVLREKVDREPPGNPHTWAT